MHTSCEMNENDRTFVSFQQEKKFGVRIWGRPFLERSHKIGSRKPRSTTELTLPRIPSVRVPAKKSTERNDLPLSLLDLFCNNKIHSQRRGKVRTYQKYKKPTARSLPSIHFFLVTRIVSCRALVSCTCVVFSLVIFQRDFAGIFFFSVVSCFLLSLFFTLLRRPSLRCTRTVHHILSCSIDLLVYLSKPSPHFLKVFHMLVPATNQSQQVIRLQHVVLDDSSSGFHPNQQR